MKTAISIGLIGFLFLFGSKIKLLDATAQEWVGGIQASGYGTNYKLTLKARGDNEVFQVDEIWIGEDYFEVSAKKNLANRSDQIYSKKDTVYVTVSVNLKPDGKGGMKKVGVSTKAKPKEYEGVGLLGYSWKGKKKYFVIRDVGKLQKLIYP